LKDQIFVGFDYGIDSTGFEISKRYRFGSSLHLGIHPEGFILKEREMNWFIVPFGEWEKNP
jgi:hypothetical protein